MLKGHNFLAIQMAAQLCKFKISRLQQLQIRVNVPWFLSQGYLNSNSINYLCTQHFEIQWAACSPKSQCFPEIASNLQSKGGENLFAQLHRGQKLPGSARRRLSNKDTKTRPKKKKKSLLRTSYALGQKLPLCRTMHCKACVSPQGLRWFWFTVVSVLCPESAKHKNLLK